MVTPQTPLSSEDTAGTDSPPEQQFPFPATVVMIPVATVTFRTRSLPASTKYKLLLESTARLTGDDSCAVVAAVLSPEKPALPFPATVEMTPLGVTFRTRLLF